MASPPPVVSQPTPLRTVESPTPALHHPTPDLQSLQGAYIGNIERLEDRAERMSEHGSDLGEEIRKLQLEQKLSDSRRASLVSAGPVEDAAKPFATRRRNASTSSYANSIVDVNGAARWGGYSPGGYMTSPGGSLRSSSISHQTAMQRQRSDSRASRLGQVVTAEENDEGVRSPLDGPTSPESHKPGPSSAPQIQQRSTSSFTRKYEQIAQEIRSELEHGLEEDHLAQRHMQDDSNRNYLDIPDRPATSLSTDTTHQARTLWQDFDGSHAPDTVLEEDPAELSGNGSRDSSVLMSAGQPPLPAAPPPDEGMVFYPAPVPQMLNLPKRLSKAPAANVQARRRTQLLESMHVENRKSAAWLPEPEADSPKPNRKSRQSLMDLPPALRASAYFDQVGPAQEFEVKGESAQETLDSILEASAHAPVSAFTDHPFAGRVGDEVYGKNRHGRSTSKIDLGKTDNRKSRSSLNLLDTRRNSSGDPLNKLKKRNSSADLNMLTVRASESRMDLADELDDPGDHARGPDQGGDRTPTRRSVDGEGALAPEDRDEKDEEVEEEEEEEEQYVGPPTTLLAELQMRKQQQKSRNLTAATAFPNGMHATLLELDAVAEVEKKKRKSHKVNLAWEADAQVGPQDEDSDDDVPLGVLYRGREGLVNKKTNARPQTSDWDRPLGLIAKRELEDTEPLSRRRTRLLGAEPNKRLTQMPELTGSQQHLGIPTISTPQPEEDEDGGEETLAQRIRRLKNQQALDSALGTDVRKSTVSGEFAADMMSQFGLNDEEKPEEKSEEKPKPPPSPENDEEETLGQRRARLQAEALARGDANPLGSRPPLRGSMSLANLLSAHPIDNTNAPRKVSDEMLLSSLPRGSLLHQNAVEKSRRDAKRLDQTKRISSFGHLTQPLVGAGKAAPEQAIAGNIQAYKDRLAGNSNPSSTPRGAVPSMMFSPMGGMTPAMSTMNLAGQRDSYFPQGNMAMGGPLGMPGMAVTPNSGFVYPGSNMMPQQMAMNMGMMGMPMNGMQGMTNPYQQMGGLRQSSMMNLPTMQMQQHPMMMEPPMDTRQRDMIDQWRNGVV